jgi:hypothetical protein
MRTKVKLILPERFPGYDNTVTFQGVSVNFSRTYTFKMSLMKIELGSGNLKGAFGFGKKKDYTYDVPENAVHVSIHYEDMSSNNFNYGNGNGKATLCWYKAPKKARVCAWVNGALGSPNEVRWTVYCWIKV